jgi:hypothetical protein
LEDVLQQIPLSCFHHSPLESSKTLCGIELIFEYGCPALFLGYVYSSKEE